MNTSNHLRSPTDVGSAVTLVQKSGRADELAIIGPPLSLSPQSLCVNSREPDLLEAVNFLLTNYRADGTLSALDKEYVGNDSQVTLLSIIGY